MPKLDGKNRISRESFYRVVELLKICGLPRIVISRRTGITCVTIARIAEGTHYYQTGKNKRTKPPKKTMPKQVGPRRKNRQEVYLPTPEDIEAACQEIRATWREPEPDEENPNGWMPPVVCAGEFPHL